MKSKFTIILVSVLAAMMLLSSGYGKWEKKLYINGNIKVIPDPVVLAGMNEQLEDLQIQFAEQKAYEKQQNLLAEQQRLLLEQQKLPEEQMLINQINSVQIPEAVGDGIIENVVNDVNLDVQGSVTEPSNEPKETSSVPEEPSNEAEEPIKEPEEASSVPEEPSKEPEEASKEIEESTKEQSNSDSGEMNN